MVATDLDFAALIESFDRRLHYVEQLLTSSTIMGAANAGSDGDFPDGIVVGGIPIDATPPGAVTGLSVVPGTFYDEIFADAEWTEDVTGADAVSFDVELALKTAGPTYTVVSIETTAGTNFRFRGLQPNTAYGVRILAVSNLGVRSAATAWYDFTTSTDATAPIAIGSAPTVGRGATTVIVKFTPLTEAQAFDVANGRGIYEVQIDTSTGFASADLHSKYTNEQVTGFSDITTQAVWYARVRAIDSSGNVGPWSATSSGQNAGAVDGAWAFDLNASTITTGTLLGTFIGTSTMPISAVTTSTLTATTISLGTTGKIAIASGGSITVGSVPTSYGIVINSAGMYVYGGGVQKLAIDASTGNISLVGSLTSGSSITGATITGSTINVNNPTVNGIRFDSTGINAYKSSAATFQVDSVGNVTVNGATITGGTFRTAVTGNRVEMETGFASFISFYMGLANELGTGESDPAGTTYPKAPGVFGGNGAKPELVARSGAIWVDIGGGTYVRNNASITLRGSGYYSGVSASIVSIGATNIDIITTSGRAQVASNRLEVPAHGGQVGCIGGSDDGANMHYGQAPAILGQDGHVHTWNWTGSEYVCFTDDTGMVYIGRSGAQAYINFFDGGSWGTKNFTINHPLDDERWLVHACPEGPEAEVVYGGNHELIDGIAWIELPAYFESLTLEEGRKIQITCEDDGSDEFFTPRYSRIENGRFRVRGPKGSSTKFSWSVTAIRKDVPRLIAEPKKDEVEVNGFGPYTFVKNLT